MSKFEIEAIQPSDFNISPPNKFYLNTSVLHDPVTRVNTLRVEFSPGGDFSMGNSIQVTDELLSDGYDSLGYISKKIALEVTSGLIEALAGAIQVQVEPLIQKARKIIPEAVESFAVLTPKPYFEGPGVLAELSALFPVLEQTIVCEYCGREESLARAIMCANDIREMTREEIADWVDSLGLDTKIKEVPYDND